ncbi:hypothetical protein DUI87_09967 [Hirundo rustica rustica]|uniref:Uncharacterized protein n=1 Tax=Hirundo rustica rustica TaxID=333673 RepID=A0A3M0KIJ0_HIRRU|nr:hypothetical protein DUI87_09967 [Hirundo rustica rustica]
MTAANNSSPRKNRKYAYTEFIGYKKNHELPFPRRCFKTLNGFDVEKSQQDLQRYGPVQESGREKVTSAEVLVVPLQNCSCGFGCNCAPLRQGHFLPQKAKHANACTQQMGFGKELVVGSALGQGCGGSAQEVEVQSVSYHAGSMAKAALS